MANVLYNPRSAPSVGTPSSPKIMAGGKPASAAMPMKTAKWPGLPGKAQPVDRGKGTPKVKKHFVSEGI